jgi:hypothetical protein
MLRKKLLLLPSRVVEKYCKNLLEIPIPVSPVKNIANTNTFSTKDCNTNIMI